MENIPSDFKEIVLNKTFANQQKYVSTNPNTKFNTLIDKEASDTQETNEDQEEFTKNVTIQELELKNLNYLNKVFLSLVL